jgi:hypothetical protein
MYCLALAGRTGEARAFASAIQRAQPGYGAEDFLTAFKIDSPGQLLVRQAQRMISG